MANDKFKKYAQGAKDAVGAKYDSDEDLPEESRKRIKNASWTDAQKVREEEWEKQETYPKLKKLVKGAWYGDKRKPRE